MKEVDCTVLSDAQYDKVLADEEIGIVDWKESPIEVLIVVDDLLKPFGLELVEYGMGDDSYYFKIVKREE